MQDRYEGIASAERDRQAPLTLEHAYMSEISRFLEVGKSLIVYHHAARVSHEMQLVYLKLRLKADLGPQNVRVLSLAKSPRFYFLLIQPRHSDIITEALRSSSNSACSSESLNAFNINENLNERLLQICKP